MAVQCGVYRSNKGPSCGVFSKGDCYYPNSPFGNPLFETPADRVWQGNDAALGFRCSCGSGGFCVVGATSCGRSNGFRGSREGHYCQYSSVTHE